MYKLKNTNGKVKFLLRSGKDFVQNEMSIAAAQDIINNGKVTDSDKTDYPICVNDEWFFEGTIKVQRVRV